jgi:hypothetical protein
MDAFSFKPVVDTPPQIDRTLSVRLCREGELARYHELMRQHHYLKGGRSAGTPCATSLRWTGASWGC